MAKGSLIEPVSDLSPDALDSYDEIIDTRSPSEFAEDRLPGAINLPVLDDAERARVGTIYTQDSHFLARRVGAGLVAQNIAKHLETALADRGSGYRPLIYCWRGGMRSNAMATLFARIGWRCGLVQGGYKSWRRGVVAALRSEGTLAHNLVLLDGQTGVAKTDVLNRASALGAQIIDLEGLAAHRGSVFGLMGEAQPAQKLFESRLWERLRRLDPAQPALVEAESSTIGKLHLPRRLWTAMQAAPRIEITAPLNARARYLTTAYADLIENPEMILTAIGRLKPFQPKARIAAWIELAGAGEYEALARELMKHHYDPAYLRSRDTGAVRETVATDDLSEGAVMEAAREVRRSLSN